MSETLDLKWLDENFPGAKYVLEYVEEHGTHGAMVRPTEIHTHVKKSIDEYANEDDFEKLLNRLDSLQLIKTKTVWGGGEGISIYGVWATDKGNEIRWDLAQSGNFTMDSSVNNSFNNNQGNTAMGSIDNSLKAGNDIVQNSYNKTKNSNVNKEISDFIESNKSDISVEILGKLFEAKNEENLEVKKTLLEKAKELLSGTAKATTFIAALTTIISHI